MNQYLELSLIRDIPRSTPVPEGWEYLEDVEGDLARIKLSATSIKQTSVNKAPLLKYAKESIGESVTVGGVTHAVDWTALVEATDSALLNATRVSILDCLAGVSTNPEVWIDFFGELENRELVQLYVDRLVPTLNTDIGDIEDGEFGVLLRVLSEGDLAFLSGDGIADQFHYQFPSIPVEVFTGMNPEERLEVFSLWSAEALEDEATEDTVIEVPINVGVAA